MALKAGSGMVLGAGLGMIFGILVGQMVLDMVFGTAFGLVFGRGCCPTPFPHKLPYSPLVS